MASLDVSIPSTSTSNAGKPHTVYNVTVRQPLRSYTLIKRYTDFVELHSTITSQSKDPPPAPLPGKSWFKSTISSPELTEDRRKGLETYLKAIGSAENGQWRQSVAWRQFLNLPASSITEGKGSNSKAAAVRQTDLGQTTIVDPTVWLDIHRELRAQLVDARQALRKRTEATTAQVQHEASAEAKRYLVRSGTTIAALETGLHRLSEQSKARAKGKSEQDGGPQLGEGEIRRRKDLLSAAIKERDALEAQHNSFAMKNNHSADAAAVATDAQKAGLFQASTSSGNQRRVLGGHAKETDRTRQLDNEGVLQLQKQIMQEQDEDVDSLTHSVRRMREMGIQINNELAYQNEMLDMLDQDVERVGDKINIAKKRIAQIK